MPIYIISIPVFYSDIFFEIFFFYSKYHRMDILVSVVIPVYNAENLINSCLDSVLNQTYKNIEIIVVNDGSTDSTSDVLDEYRRKSSSVNLQIVHQVNSGPSVARNVGIRLARGKYIAFLDSDDIWRADKIEKQMEFLSKNPGVVILGTLFSTLTTDQSEPYSYVSLGKLLFCNYFITSSVVCCSNVLEEHKFNEKQKHSEDYRLWLEIIAEYDSGVILNQGLVIGADKRRFGDHGLSSALWSMEKGELSNLLFLYNAKYISMSSLICAVSWSFLKYFRRLIICMF